MTAKLAAVVLIASLGIVGCGHKSQRPDSIWSRSSVSLIPPIAVERDYDQRPFDLELALRSLNARDASLARSARPRRATAASRGAKRSQIGGCSLDTIKARESGNNYGAVSRSGKHRGAHQFDAPTWRGAVTRAGHPEYASTPVNEVPPDVQDAAAAQLYSERGTAPWSVCRMR